MLQMFTSIHGLKEESPNSKMRTSIFIADSTDCMDLPLFLEANHSHMKEVQTSCGEKRAAENLCIYRGA